MFPKVNSETQYKEVSYRIQTSISAKQIKRKVLVSCFQRSMNSIVKKLFYTYWFEMAKSESYKTKKIEG